jgi:hypothetical protein
MGSTKARNKFEVSSLKVWETTTVNQYLLVQIVQVMLAKTINN